MGIWNITSCTYMYGLLYKLLYHIFITFPHVSSLKTRVLTFLESPTAISTQTRTPDCLRWKNIVWNSLWNHQFGVGDENWVEMRQNQSHVNHCWSWAMGTWSSVYYYFYFLYIWKFPWSKGYFLNDCLIDWSTASERGLLE